MRRYLARFLVVAVVMLLASPALAVEFQPLGFESASMGGAGVASAKGSYAAYYNPALLAERRHGMEIALSAGVGLRELNVGEHIDRLADADIAETLDRIANNAPGGANTESDRNNITTIKNELRALSGRNGLQVMPSAVLGVQIGSFGFGAYSLSEATAHAVIDSTRLDVIIEYGGGNYAEYDEVNDLYIDYGADNTQYQQRSLEYALDNRLTYLKLTGLAYMEIPIAYGHQVSTAWGTLDLGASFKVMPGYTFDDTIKIDTESDDVDSELEDAEESDSSWGVDVGLLFKPARLPKLSIGLVGKNLNTPEFDTVTGHTLEVDPQVRAGLAYDLWGDRITVAIDADLTNNETFIPDYDSQFIGGGVNFHPFSWLCLRAGAMRNMQESDDGTIITAGLGFGLKWFQLDIAGQASTEEGEFDEDEIPRYARVQVSLVSKWF